MLSIAQFQKSLMRFTLTSFLLVVFCAFSKAQVDPFYPSNIDSEEIDSVYREAMLALMNGEQKKFFRNIEKVIVADSTCLKAVAHAAFQTYRISKGEEPFGYLTGKALKIDSRDRIDAAYVDVLKAQLAGTVDSIPGILEKMVKENEAIEGYFLLGSFYEDAGDFEAAHLNYYRAYRIDSSVTPIYYPLSQTSEVLGYPQLSDDLLKSYVEMNSKSARTCDVYGNYLMKKGNAEEAIKQFKMAYELDNAYTFSLEKAEKLISTLIEQNGEKKE